MAGGSGSEQNYWPGFVDALSNVVLTLVFVLVVFVFALVMASSKVEQKANEIIQAAQEQHAEKARQETEAMALELEQAKAELDKLRPTANKIKIIESKAETEAERTAPLRISALSNGVVLVFPPAVSGLSENNIKDLDKIFFDVKPEGTKYRIEIRSTVGRESYSIANRLAYYRAMNLRNYLINQKLGVDVSITSKILPPTKAEDGRVEIIFDK